MTGMLKGLVNDIKIDPLLFIDLRFIVKINMNVAVVCIGMFNTIGLTESGY
jgi:hypothetical protein